jgi:trans-2,3-dihydro-3-hydroxyanthranilate isomerase
MSATSTIRLDMTGLSCPLPLLGAKKMLDDLPDGQHRRVIEQGYEMGRPSLITLSLDVAGGKLHAVRIGGHAVRVAEGKIEV